MSLRRSYGPDVPAVERRELWAWALFDFANSGYTTVVITAIFNAYFVGVVAAGHPAATLWWTAALSLSYLVVMAVGPQLGALADRDASKRRALLWTSLICIAGTAALAGVGSGQIALALGLVVLTNIAFGLGENLIAAFLPELARPEAFGRLSGYGWGLGYLGGMLVLALCLYWIQQAPPEGTSAAVRQCMLITAVAFLLAALPTFLWLRERAAPVASAADEGFWSGWRALDDLRDLRRLLYCIVAYQAGVGTVITVAAIYTQEALGFTPADSIKLILVVNLSAAVGAWVFGPLADLLGHRAALGLSLCGWLAALLLLGLDAEGRWIWWAANLAGLCLGASQSAGRAMVAYLCPPEREGRVFGFWGVAVKASMVVGPLAYGSLSWLSGGDHRLAMICTGVFFVAGLLLLLPVNVVRGRTQAAGGAT
ncbi:MAG: MFS transporter [Lysobacterales bacterium]